MEMLTWPSINRIIPIEKKKMITPISTCIDKENIVNGSSSERIANDGKMDEKLDYEIIRSIHILMEIDADEQAEKEISIRDYRVQVRQLLQQLMVKLGKNMEYTTSLENRLEKMQVEKNELSTRYESEIEQFRIELRNKSQEIEYLKDLRKKDLLMVIKQNNDLRDKIRRLNDNFQGEEESSAENNDDAEDEESNDSESG